MYMKNLIRILIGVTFSFGQIVSGQESDSSPAMLHRPFQISFVTPMGTNGMESGKYTNNFSFNILAGYAGGVDGFELGGFSNFISHDVTGMEIAGFCNTVMGQVKGGQISGFSNVCRKSMKGIQIAGFSNVIIDSAQVCQVSGFSNVVKGKTKGAQVTGFSNYSNGDSEVAQIAGFSNVTNGSVKGTQVAGFMNYAHTDSKDIQIAGFSNTTKGNLIGAQVSGFSNVVTGDITGVQVSGFFNYAKRVKGSQISFINVCDTIENGVAIGFLSIVKKGYRALEIGADETLYAQMSFKMGTEKFYNILSLGGSQKSNNLVWGWGYGIGTLMNISPRINLNIDAVAYHINYNDWWTDDINLLNKLKVNVSWKLNDKISVYGGPTYNVYVSNRIDNEGNLINNSVAPWTTYNRIIRNTIVQMYPGFTAGIRFF
jgi:hypothetical protein